MIKILLKENNVIEYADDIDDRAVELAAKRAQISEHIGTLANGYYEHIGEDGGALSGGQRQRLTIARALYRKSDIIILDEATNSLDNQTELFVMEAIHSLSKHMTVIVIAHRLSTIQRADKILYMEDGNIIHQGTYSYLLKNSPEFRGLLAASSRHAGLDE